jgi:hypothetical protein
MKFLQLRWVFILLLGFGLTLTACGEDVAEEPTDIEDTAITAAEDTEAEEPEAATLEPAPDGTFAFTVQEVLSTSFPEQTGYDVEMVACPEAIELESDQPFECEVMTTAGFTTIVDVFPNPEAETFDWLTRGLNLVAIEDAIETQMSDADMSGIADCGLDADPNPYREVEVGSTFDCIFTSEDSEETTIMVTVNDDQGNVTLSTR